MRIRDIVGLVFAIAGLLIIGGLFEVGIDWFGRKFPNVMALFGFLVLTGSLLMIGYIAVGLTVHSYNKAIEHYDLNHPEEVDSYNKAKEHHDLYYVEEVTRRIADREKAHQRIADRVAWKFAIIAVGIFWICVLIRNCSGSNAID